MKVLAFAQILFAASFFALAKCQNQQELPKFFKFRRQQDAPAVVPQEVPVAAAEAPVGQPLKPSFASLQSSNVETNGGSEQNGTQANAEVANKVKPIFVPTSGVRKQCKSHNDCYGLREPNEWCPLGAKERFLENGCYCNFEENSVCVIERISNGIRQYTDCASSNLSVCDAETRKRLSQS